MGERERGEAVRERECIGKDKRATAAARMTASAAHERIEKGKARQG